MTKLTLRRWLLASLVLCPLASAQTGIITTIAGIDNGGFSGDGGPAASAALDGPSGIAFDASGNLFIADTGNGRIRKISTSGIITTVAGNGNDGYSGDIGPATAAALNIDVVGIGIAVDVSGNLYIADISNNRVRKVSTSGIITTVAGNGFGAENGLGGFSGDGGPATSAELFAPSGVAVDAAGNLYIADLGNMRIRKVSPSGIITTVAGSGCTITAAAPNCGGFSGDGGPATSATLNHPGAIALDAAGNLYIADNENNRIRKVSTAGIITTVAGNGPVCAFSSLTCTGGFSGDGGPATSAALNFPESISVDSAGNLYIADTGNLRVRKVSVAGIINTVAGDGVFDHNIFDSAGDGGPATSAELNDPEGVAVDAAGNLYIADALRGRVREVALAVLLTQTINFAPLSAQVLGTAPFTISATATSGLAVTFTSNTLPVCTVSGATVTLVAAGTCSITAAQAGNATYAAATPVTQSFTVTGAASSPLTWTLNGVFADGGTASGVFTYDSTTGAFSNWNVSTMGGNTSVFFPFVFTPANSSLGFNRNDQSGLTISFGSYVTYPDPAAGQAEILVLGVTLVSPLSNVGGVINIATASLYSEECFNCDPYRAFSSGTVSAGQASQTAQTIIFGALSNVTLGTAPFTIGATASSGLPVSFTWPTVSVCTVSGNTVTVLAVGVCSITASQAGNATYSAAAPVTQSFTVTSAATLSVTPASLSFQSAAGTPAQPQSLQIGGTPGIAWQATAATSTGGAWLSVSPTTGQIPMSLSVVVASASLAAGTYRGSITVQAPGASPSSITVNVMLTVTAPSGGIITTVAGNGGGGFSGDGSLATLAQLAYPFDVAVDASGNLFIADRDNNRIRKVSASGIITTVAGNGTVGYNNGGYSGDGGPATSALLWDPDGIAVDAAGNLFFVDSGNGAIRKVSASGIITTVAGNGTFGFSGDGGPATSAALRPSGVAVDAAGNLFIADISNNRIREVSASGVITTVAGSSTGGFSGDGGPATSAALHSPTGVAVDAFGNLYIADQDNSRIRKVSTSGIITTVAGGGTGGDGGPATAAALGYPSGVAVDASGNLFIADYGHNVIRKVSTSGIITTVAGNGTGGLSGDGGPATSAELSSPTRIAVDASGNVFISDDGNNRIREVPAPAAQVLAITPGGIVPFDSTVNTIQPGEWVSIFGTNFALSTTAWQEDFPTTLGGTSVTIDGLPAYLSMVSPTQINLQAPDDTTTGPVSVVVTTPNGTATSTVTLAPFSPSFLLADSTHVSGIILRSDGSGSFGGGTFDIIGPTGNSLGYPTVAAKAGDSIELYAVGLGATTPPVPSGQAFSGNAPTTNPVGILINNTNVTPTLTALSSAGMYRIDLTVPAGLGAGDVALAATVGGAETQANVVIPLQ